MLLSKRPEMFLPENWPSYFSKAKGCKVWDLDGTELIDMSIMGIGTNTLLLIGAGGPGRSNDTTIHKENGGKLNGIPKPLSAGFQFTKYYSINLPT